MRYFSDCKTLDEAKRCFRSWAASLHPDCGGNAQEFAKMRADFEAFRPISEKYDGETKQWQASDFADVIMQLMAIPKIKIEICGSFIWISGLTKDDKQEREQLKAVDGGQAMSPARFAAKKKLWYFSPKGYRRKGRKTYSHDEIQNRYGSETIKRNKHVSIA